MGVNFQSFLLVCQLITSSQQYVSILCDSNTFLYLIILIFLSAMNTILPYHQSKKQPLNVSKLDLRRGNTKQRMP